MPDVNGMQANMGLSGAGMSPTGIATPSPADTALRLSMESAQRVQQSQQIISSAPLGAPAAFRYQFQQQMAAIQSQQSMNPYAAQMLSHSMPSQQQQYMPSPLTMTPPSSGVFRTPPPPAVAPMPPVYAPMSSGSPFTPQAPSPMFSSPQEQAMRQQDARANARFAYASQAPNMAGQGLGYAGGALMGARMGAGFGPWGAALGAAGGAIAAGASGVASGMGNMFQSAMGPTIEQRQMGAGIQHMSRNWAVTGQHLSPFGRGLSRDASISMAGEVQDLASNNKFQQQTGGMFNRQDLMQVMRKGGQAGLFDMAQEVPQIKQQLQQTANTIRQFMELTNDPDVSNVIRQMGRMRQFGMSQQEMVTAAQGMKTYSRAAGTSLGGLEQMGGLPGAATFQGVGLSAGQGLQYGNFAAASAQQMAASGSISPRQLAQLGGVQGMAQRDIQAQAAFASMPLFGAANAGFGSGGWGVNSSRVGEASQGAFGMVNNALQSMNQGVQRGGIGALASFPLHQKDIADRALGEMTPMQQQAQRFNMAMSTGSGLGLKGQGAFAAGAQVLYGDEVAGQMMTQASSPEFWKSQRQMIAGRQRELGVETQMRAEDAAPALDGIPRDIGRGLGLTGRGSWGRGVGNFFGGIGEGFEQAGGAIGGVFGGIGDSWDDYQTDKAGGIARRFKGGGALKAGVASDYSGAVKSTKMRANRASADMTDAIDAQALVNAANLDSDGAVGVGQKAAGYLSWLDPSGIVSDTTLTEAMAGTGAWLSANATNDPKAQRDMVRKYIEETSATLETVDRAKVEGGEKKNVVGAIRGIEKAMGSKGKGAGMGVLKLAGNKLDALVYERGSTGKKIVASDFRAALRDSLVESGVSKKDAAKAVKEMEASGELAGVKAQMVHYGKATSRDPSIWTDVVEGETREDHTKMITNAANARTDALTASIEPLEDKLDVDSFLGDYSDTDESMQKIAAKGGKEFALLAAAAAGSGDADDQSQAKWNEVSAKYGLSAEDQFAYQEKAAALSEDEREKLADMASRGSVEDLEQYGNVQQRKQLQSAFAGEGFMKKVGKYSSKIEGYMATSGDEMTAAGIAKQFTDKELRQMSRTAGGRELAGLLKKSQGTGKGAEEAQAKLSQFAVQQRELDEEGREVVGKVKGEGEEAKQLAKSEASMDEMSALFSDFRPAAKDLAVGAKALREAMDSEMFAKMQGD